MIGYLNQTRRFIMVRLIKKILSLLSVVIGLSNGLALAMPSRITRASSAISRAAVARSLARSLLPNPVLRMPHGPIVPMPQIRPLPAVIGHTEPRAAWWFPGDKIRANKENSGEVQVQKPKATKNPGASGTAASQKKAEKSEKIKVKTAKKPSPVAEQSSEERVPVKQETAPASRPSFEQKRLIWQMQQPYDAATILDQGEPMPQAMVQEPVVQSIAQINIERPITIGAPVAAQEQLIQQSDNNQLVSMAASPSAIARSQVLYNQAMHLLEPVLRAFNAMRVSQEQAQYVKAHNELAHALGVVANQGYSVGLVEKQLIEKMRSLPGAQLQLLHNQLGAGNVIIPAKALGVMGIAQASSYASAIADKPAVANLLGLHGEFVPFIYKHKNIPALGNGADAVLEVVHASMNKNNPSLVDRSRIVIQPLPQLMSPAENADMRLIEQPVAGNGGNGNNNNGQQANNYDLNPRQEPKINRAALKHGSNGAGNNNGSANNRQYKIPNSNPARNLGAAGFSEAGDQVNPVIAHDDNPDVNPGKGSVSDDPEIPGGPSPKTSGEPNKAQREITVSEEESAIGAYGNVILQALDARAALLEHWAGKSQTLLEMFNSYNALREQWHEINDIFSHTLYWDSNRRMYKVVSDVLISLQSSKN